MAVSFERYGRLYYLDPGQSDYRVGDRVLVPTISGPEVAECVWGPEWVAEEFGSLPVCAGMASETQLQRDAANRRRRAEAKLVARRLIKKNDLPMKVTAVDFLDAGEDYDQLVVIYFTAPHRVDFRALVSELARSLRARVDLRRWDPGTRPGWSAVSEAAAASCAAPHFSRTSNRLACGWRRRRICRPTRSRSPAPAAG
jgi:cell fate regulator YaaT (PSP1 superfamily)